MIKKKPAAKKALTKLRAKPGMSNAKAYKRVAKSDFAGPNESYPINTRKRGESALKLAHNLDDAKKEASVRRKVFAKYPSLYNSAEYTKTGYKKAGKK